MDQKTTDIRMAQWKKIILEGNRAPVTKREWCRQNGISEKTFFYWQRKIRCMAAASLDKATAQLPASPVQSIQQAFVEIPFSREPSGPTDIEAASLNISPELMVQVKDCRIFVNGTIQENTLKTVMKVIRDA